MSEIEKIVKESDKDEEQQGVNNESIKKEEATAPYKKKEKREKKEKKEKKEKVEPSKNKFGPGRTKQSNIGSHLLENIKQLIDLSIQRGVFQPTEITDVGTVYNELASKLKSLMNDEENQDFNLNLLINLRKIIDVSILRGAYKGIELSSIGKVYDEYNTNLNILIDDFQFNENVKKI